MPAGVDPVYASVAKLYHAAGWAPLPVPPRQKHPVPRGFTGYMGKYPDLAEIERWAEGSPDWNVALRLPPTVVGIDVDVYHGGRAGLDELEAQLGHLPPTIMSTSRTDGSGIRLFRVEQGLAFPKNPAQGVDIVQRHHRYVMAYPSIHPDTDKPYEWVDSVTGLTVGDLGAPDSLPELPWSWVNGLAIDEGSSAGSATPEEVRDFFSEHDDERSKPSSLKGVRSQLDSSVNTGAGRHDTLVKIACMAMREAAAGYYTAREVRDVLYAWWREVMDDPRRVGDDEAEFGSAISFAVNAALADPERIAELRGRGNPDDFLKTVLGPSTTVVVNEPDEPMRPSGFRFYNPADLLSMPMTFEWIVKRVLVDPTYGQIAGEMKTLKSYIGLCLDLAIASGKPFLGEFDVAHAAPVVAIVGEGGRVPWTRRLVRVAEAMELEAASLPLVATFDVAPIESERFISSIKGVLDECKPKLLHIDPYYAYHGKGTDNRNLHEEGALLAALTALCAETETSLLVNNHFNQTGSGNSSDLKRITGAGSSEWVDSWLTLEHRERPDVDSGQYRLTMNVGSRQWGGASWDVDFSLGRMGEDNNYDSPITFHASKTKPKEEHDAERHEAAKEQLKAELLEALRRSDRPLGRSEWVTLVKGRRADLIAARDELIAERHELGITCEPGDTYTLGDS